MVFLPQPKILPPRKSISLTQVIRRAQAALPSVCRMLGADDPAIEIRRGFLASGISRTNSICSKPLSNAAPLTWT